MIPYLILYLANISKLPSVNSEFLFLLLEYIFKFKSNFCFYYLNIYFKAGAVFVSITLIYI